MARIRPSLEDLDQLVTPLTPGELTVAQALARLDDEWTVYIKPRVGLNLPDFVAIHDLLGVCVVEVKDWEPGRHRRSEQGVIETCDEAGTTWRRVPLQPRFQAARHRFTVYDQFFALPSDGGAPTEAIRSVVILPQYTDEQANALLADPTASDGERQVAVWGSDGIASQLDKVVCGNGCAHPRPESILRLREHVIPSVIPTEAPAPIRLTPDARNIEQNQSGAKIRRVRGPAGCGKSIGLTARAAHLASQGKRVLMLSFNVTLADRLSRLATARCAEIGANPTLISASNFHSFCTRVVQDAEQLGIVMTPPKGASWPVAIVAKAQQAFEAGFQRHYDAVLVDEGQDFALSWWNLLREHVVIRGGEMLLLTDPTQDLYNKRSWTTEERMLNAGFNGQWTDLKGSYRLPSDVVPLANAFADTQLDGERLPIAVLEDHRDIVGLQGPTIRRWKNVDNVPDVGVEIGLEVVRLLREHPHLSPRDIVFLCEYHHDGVTAVAVIEAAGYPVHHLFSRNPDEARRRRKYRFWPDAEAVKGCTVHSFKGWETPALVMGIGVERRSKRLAYVAMTRVKAGGSGTPAYISVINADKRIKDFSNKFESWPAPLAEMRVG
ncbi:MAG: NERD domain-containing protein/DEAD/DEAH box helicase [Ilumatobacter sp.]|nr:NERD domain-containing protein/DEAD/DEAH box helicase [Ilumatobacter sp.]